MDITAHNTVYPVLMHITYPARYNRSPLSEVRLETFETASRFALSLN
jgi:hypothetical protein